MTLPLTSPFTANSMLTKAQLDQLVASVNALIPVDSGWQALTVVAANFSAGSPTPKYRTVTWANGTVFVELTGVIQRSVVTPATGTAFNGAAIFNPLPAALRPAAFHIYTTWTTTSGARTEFEIFADGTLQVRNQGTVDIPANTNMGLDGCKWLAG